MLTSSLVLRHDPRTDLGRNGCGIAWHMQTVLECMLVAESECERLSCWAWIRGAALPKAAVGLATDVTMAFPPLGLSTAALRRRVQG